MSQSSTFSPPQQVAVRRFSSVTPPMQAQGAPVQLRHAACALAALRALALPLEDAARARGVADAAVAGRLQRFKRGGVEVVVDVGHNPQAAAALADWLRAQPRRRTLAVYAALADKDAAGVATALVDTVDGWLLAGSLDAGSRGSDAAALAQRLAGTVAAGGTRHADVADALAAALAQAAPDGRVLAFGSFHAASEALRHLNASD